MTPAEENVILKIKKGDIHVFERLYKELHPRLYAFSRKFIDDKESAKDIVQEVFIDFWEHREFLDEQIPVRPYIFRMLRNKCLNAIRDKKIQNEYKNYAAVKLKETEWFFYNQESYKSIFFRDIQEILQKSIQEMPQGCRQLFILSREEGLSNNEIAFRLNISVRTVENQIYRALKILKENLKDYLL